MDKAKFYAGLRKRNSGVFGTRISARQVRGMEGILEAFITHGDGRPDTLAYGLATVYHETGRQMVPVREGFAKTDAGARRIVRRRKYGKPVGPYGHVYYGRGHVQLTWEDNYIGSSDDAGVDLHKYPDKMLDPVISARVLWRGLLDGRWNGRGKGIQYYLERADLRNARRTVNITDKWKQIADYYHSFLAEIMEAGGVPEKSPHKPADKQKPGPAPKQPGRGKTPSQPAYGGFFNMLASFIRKLLGRK